MHVFLWAPISIDQSGLHAHSVTAGGEDGGANGGGAAGGAEGAKGAVQHASPTNSVTLSAASVLGIGAPSQVAKAPLIGLHAPSAAHPPQGPSFVQAPHERPVEQKELPFWYDASKPPKAAESSAVKVTSMRLPVEASTFDTFSQLTHERFARAGERIEAPSKTAT